MKKLLSLILALALLLSAAAFAEDADAAALPQVGDVVEGFTVKELREFPLVGATIVCFEHERTGAELLYIANEDTNRVFDLTFFTRAIDNTGLPHVFEHSTLDGSAKYPSKTLFFNLSYQTYNTYMNASTYLLMTTYPVASLSEAQLLKYADYYTDSCLNPTIMEDESIFREEAWRYRLADADDALTIEGTVYSEMLGARNLASTAYTNMFRTAFPGSTIGNVSGGEPEHIPEMTWETLKNYHDLYYHPSNCVAYLYGQFDDYTAFLRLLDEAFAPFEKREFTFEDEGYAALEAPAEAGYAFPVEAGSNTDNASTVYYAIVCPGLKADLDEEQVLNTLTDLLTVDASPLMQALKKALPTGDFGCYIETQGPEDAIVFSAANVDPEEAETFRTTVDSVLADIAENGFADDMVESVMASLSLSIKLSSESSSIGVNVIPSLAYSYAASGDPFNYVDYVDALDSIDEWNAQGLYKEAVSKWLVGSETTALSTTYPEPGLREQLDAAEAERLAGVKAEMTDEEIQVIVDQSNAADEADDSAAYVAQLQAVTVESLPEEIREYEISDETGADGVRRLNAVANVDGIGQPSVFLDASGLAQEDIHWFALLLDLVGELDTSAYTREELAVLQTRYLYDGEIRLSLMGTYENQECHPYLRFGWKAMDEDLEAGYDLMYELLFGTQFTDAETLLGLIQQKKAALKSSITASPLDVVLYRGFSRYSPLYAYYSYFSFLDYYAFLDEAEQLMQNDPDAVAVKLEAVQAYFHNRANAVAAFAGSEESIAVNAPLADAFLAKLDENPVEPVEYAFPEIPLREALIVDSNVQYNGVIADFKALGLDGFAGDLDALSAVGDDLYLLPMLRDQYGAYGAYNGFTDQIGMYAYTYRDPNVRETFDVYEAMPEFMASLEIDQETLNGYILSAYAGYAMPTGELTGAAAAMSAVVNGEDADRELEYMRELKALTPEKVRDYAYLYENLMASGYRFTAGGAAAINANAELYDQILNPFGAVDTTEVEFVDAAEGSEHYEAVRYVYENMLMLPAAEDSFGVDDTATLGDLAGALYAAIGGDASVPDEAVATLAQYGIVDATGSASDELTGVTADAVLDIFSDAIQIPYEANAEASDEALTRGELAEVLKGFFEALE